MLNKLKSTTTIVTAIILVTLIFAVYSIISPIPSAIVVTQEETAQSVSSARSYSVSSSPIAAVTFESSASSSTDNVIATIMAFKEKLDALNSRQTREEMVDWYYQQGISLDPENLRPTKSQYSSYDAATLASLANNGDREAITETGKRIRRQGNFDQAKEKLNTAAAMGSLDALRELATHSELELNKLTRKIKSTPEITTEQVRSKQLEVLARYDALLLSNDIIHTDGFSNTRNSLYAQYGKNLTDDDKNLIQMHLATFNSELSNIRQSLNIAEEPRVEIPKSVKTYMDTLAEFTKFCAQNSGACEKTAGAAKN